MRPYVGQMVAASVMLAVAGAMMTLVVATLKPMVNEVLLAKPAVFCRRQRIFAGNGRYHGYGGHPRDAQIQI